MSTYYYKGFNSLATYIDMYICVTIYVPSTSTVCGKSLSRYIDCCLRNVQSWAKLYGTYFALSRYSTSVYKYLPPHCLAPILIISLYISFVSGLCPCSLSCPLVMYFSCVLVPALCLYPCCLSFLSVLCPVPLSLSLISGLCNFPLPLSFILSFVPRLLSWSFRPVFCPCPFVPVLFSFPSSVFCPCPLSPFVHVPCRVFISVFCPRLLPSSLYVSCIHDSVLSLGPLFCPFTYHLSQFVVTVRCSCSLALIDFPIKLVFLTMFCILNIILALFFLKG
jgi:hypothetical protein